MILDLVLMLEGTSGTGASYGEDFPAYVKAAEFRDAVEKGRVVQ